MERVLKISRNDPLGATIISLSIECLLLSCVLLSPLSQQEDTITDFSLPNARGFSLLNLARALNCTVQLYFGIDNVPPYHVASHVFTRVRVWAGECFLSRQRARPAFACAAGSKLLFANCACERQVKCRVETNTPSGVVTCFSLRWSRPRRGAPASWHRRPCVISIWVRISCVAWRCPSRLAKHTSAP